MKLRNVFYNILVFVFVILCSTCDQFKNKSQQEVVLEFAVAGHSYGSHHGTNKGIYPKFLSKIQHQSGISYLFLVGDIVRSSNAESWNKVNSEMDLLRFPVHYVLGNHDYSGLAVDVFNEKFGNTYYAIHNDKAIFIILDGQKEWGNITDDQIAYVRSIIEDNRSSVPIFLFLHELIWTQGKTEYNIVKHNFNTYNNRFISNFWDDLYPLLSENVSMNFYIFAGDVGGNRGVIPAFYQKLSNVTLIATGMGEIKDENYLLVKILKNNDIAFELIPLNKENNLRTLEYYTLDNL